MTEQIEFATGVVIMPQRQTVRLAKQVTEINILSGGRMWLGVGWNDLEAVGINPLPVQRPIPI